MDGSLELWLTTRYSSALETWSEEIPATPSPFTVSVPPGRFETVPLAPFPISLYGEPATDKGVPPFETVTVTGELAPSVSVPAPDRIKGTAPPEPAGLNAVNVSGLLAPRVSPWPAAVASVALLVLPLASSVLLEAKVPAPSVAASADETSYVAPPPMLMTGVLVSEHLLDRASVPPLTMVLPR